MTLISQSIIPSMLSPPTAPLSRQARKPPTHSCAECRRLKLKCSRVFPCTNCVKKGCSPICPQGALTTGRGNRFVLANTEELHEKISLLANRVRELEDALAQAHSLHSLERHHLLSEPLLQIKHPLERKRPEDTPLDDSPDVEEASSNLGSLSLSESGQASFFGSQANSWYLLQSVRYSEAEVESPTAVDTPPEPSDIPWLSHAFPFSTPIGVTAQNVKQTVLSRFPTFDVAMALRDIYYRHAAWMYTPVSEQDSEAIFRQTYDQSEHYEPPRAATLAVISFILALGALLDMDKPPYSDEAMLYYHLGRVSLSIESVLEEHSTVSIQALLLMSHFMFLAEMNEPRWVVMGITVKIALSIGLHRDTGKWNVDSEETQKRRELFYELLTYDSWQSLTFGRPPSFSMMHIDNQMPHSTTTNENGEVEMSFCAWKHRFVSQCLSVVHDQAFGTRPLSYKHLQDLDKKVRNWYIPPSLQVPGFGSSKAPSGATDQPTLQLTMQRYTILAIKEITLFYMHRGFFAQALRECPNDPMGSKYSHSVLAAYNSATSCVNLTVSLYNQHPSLTQRTWFLFTHVFSCALVLGEIAMKPNMVFAKSALSQLKTAHNLFVNVSNTTKTIKMLPILAKLKDRAILAFSNPEVELGSRALHSNPTIKTEDDILGSIGGLTSLVVRRSTSPPVLTPSPPSHSHSPPSQVADPPTHYIPLSGSPSHSTWQYHNPSHVQSPNNGSGITIPMEVYPTSFSASVDMTQQRSNTNGSMQTNGMRVFYEPQPHEQIPPAHHLQPHEIPHGMNMGHLAPATEAQYYETLFGSSSTNGMYGQPHSLFNGQGPSPGMHSTPGGNPQAIPNTLQESWQSFVAQFTP